MHMKGMKCRVIIKCTRHECSVCGEGHAEYLCRQGLQSRLQLNVGGKVNGDRYISQQNVPGTNFINLYSLG